MQEIDAAAMSLWLSYRHIEADIDGAGCATQRCTVGSSRMQTDSFQYLKAGALINF